MELRRRLPRASKRSFPTVATQAGKRRHDLNGQTLETGLIRLTAILSTFLMFGAASAQITDPLYSAYDARKAELLASFGSRLFSYNDVKFTGYDTIAWTALHGCGPAAVADKMVDTVRPELLAKSVDKAAYAFVLPPITRYIFQNGQCLNGAQISRLRQWLSTPQQLFSTGTTNHAIMSAASFYLLAQRFPDLPWQGADKRSRTSADVMTQYRTLLLARLRKILSSGFDEQLSPTYAMASLYPLLNLVDFAKDPEIRNAAEAAAVAQIAAMRTASFGGAIVAPFNRETLDEEQINDDPDTNARDLLWLYFGYGSFLGRSVEPAYVSMLATALWRPPLPLLALDGRDGPAHEVVTQTPSFTIWDQPSSTQLIGSSLITSDYAVGVGDIIEKPSNPQAQSEAFDILLRDRRPAGVIQCYQPFWRSNLGENTWSDDLSSPFQQAFRSGGRGVLLYDIPPTDPWPPTVNSNPIFFHLRDAHVASLLQVVKCRLPNPPDEVITDSSGVAVRYGSVFVALRVGGGGEMLPVAPSKPAARFLEFRIHAPKTVIYFRVTRRELGTNLAQFRRQVWAEPLQYDPGQGVAGFTDDQGRTVRVTFNHDLTLHFGAVSSVPFVQINGRAQASGGNAVVKSPNFEWRTGGFVLNTARGILTGDVSGVFPR